MSIHFEIVQLNSDEFNIVELMTIKNGVKMKEMLQQIIRMGLIVMARREVIGGGTSKHYKLKKV